MQYFASLYSCKERCYLMLNNISVLNFFRNGWCPNLYIIIWFIRLIAYFSIRSVCRDIKIWKSCSFQIEKWFFLVGKWLILQILKISLICLVSIFQRFWWIILFSGEVIDSTDIEDFINLFSINLSTFLVKISPTIRVFFMPLLCLLLLSSI